MSLQTLVLYLDRVILYLSSLQRHLNDLLQGLLYVLAFGVPGDWLISRFSDSARGCNQFTDYRRRSMYPQDLCKTGAA
jgi:hypothetical protein